MTPPWLDEAVERAYERQGEHDPFVLIDWKQLLALAEVVKTARWEWQRHGRPETGQALARLDELEDEDKQRAEYITGGSNDNA